MADYYKRISHFRASPFDFDLNPENPRLCGREFNPADVSHLGDLSGMARSIAEFGVRLPIAVRKVPSLKHSSLVKPSGRLISSCAIGWSE
jgi:hypothetical protein